MNIIELTSTINPVLYVNKPLCGKFVNCLVSNFSEVSIKAELGEGTYAKVFHIATEVDDFALKVFKGKEIQADKKHFTLSGRRGILREWLSILNYNEFVCETLYALALESQSGQVELIDAETVQGYHINLSSLGEKRYLLLGLVMKYYPGTKDLWDLEIRVPDIKKIAHGILSGVKSIHDQRIMHRDIKPENVLLTREGNSLIADFGFAGRIPPRGRRYSLVGTPSYAPPKMSDAYYKGINESVHSKKIDSYSIAMTLYVLARRWFPWSEEHEREALQLLEFDKKGIADDPFLREMEDRGLASLICRLGKYHEDERITPEEALADTYFDGA